MSYDVTVTRLPISALFDLKGSQAALTGWTNGALPEFPDAANTHTERGGDTLAHIGPNHWLLRADPAREAALAAALRPADAPPEISIVLLSDNLSFFRITGPDAAQVLAIGCPLDLHDSVFPANGACFTEIFGLKAFVTRHGDGFDCAVDQSYADMTDDYLIRATT
jgi:sarcosine oxidase, subunit gamma